MSFSDRVLQHDAVSFRPPDPATAGEPVVAAIKNQLLVRTKTPKPENPDLDPAKRVEDYLMSAEIPFERIATLLTGDTRGEIEPPLGFENDDIEILHLHLEDDKEGRDIFELTEALRTDLQDSPGPDGKRSVSPNHVLIPAPEDHSCPFGPPWRADEVGDIVATTGPMKNVIIIDSGYQWDNAWGANPLDAYAGGVALAQADQLADPGVGGWQDGNPDTPDANQPGTLGALSGHANFIAGVIAQSSRYANIRVLNHNGAFPGASDDLPTEVGVIRSLCRCAAHDPDVINLGFAFAAFEDVASYAWDIGFACIRDRQQNFVVVSPAGNQNSSGRRYPAALNYRYPGRFRGMISVGSTTDANAHADDPRILALLEQMPPELLEPFSNHGPWVTCSADGALVLSTFLPLDMRVEDPPSLHVNFDSSWARWSGTSFATPRIAAKIVNVMAEQSLEARQAWEWLRDNEGGPQTPDLGYRFT